MYLHLNVLYSNTKLLFCIITVFTHGIEYVNTTFFVLLFYGAGNCKFKDVYESYFRLNFQLV